MPITLNNPNRFTFTLAQDVLVTSAGVYDQTTGKLIRTLWSNVPYKAGTHAQYWDGLDDNGNQQLYGNYNIKISSNSNAYTWEGVVGNTSTSLTDTTIWKGGTQIADMVLTGSYMKCATGFSEGVPAQCKFAVSTPNQCIVYSPRAVTQGSMMNCANSNYTFWGGMDYQAQHSFVFGEHVSNDTQATFTAGIVFTPTIGSSYPSALAVNTAPISGMAIQQAGSQYLFVSYASLNLINVYVIGDGTGRLAQSISIINPNKLCLENDTTLWIAQGTTVTKYTVNTNGTITVTTSHISGLSNACGISTYSGELAILDAGNQQIPKFYNSTTLAPIMKGTWLVGGYANTAVVSNNRFYLQDVRGQHITFIRHDATGGFWIGDSGNCRCLHFNSSGTLIETIMYVPLYTTYVNAPHNAVIYDLNICKNQPTSVFLDFREFLIDYTQPLATGWTLINNWGYNLPSGWTNSGTVTTVVLLPNSRRYMVINKNAGTYTSFGLNVTTSTTGGTLPANKYYYKIYAQNTGNSQSALCSEVSVTTTGSTSSNTLHWNPVANATGYRVFRGTSPGAQNAEYVLGNVTTFVDINATAINAIPTTYNSSALAELTSTGMRIYDSLVPPNFAMDSNGNLTTTSLTGSGSTLTTAFQKYTLTGYDSSNNLLFSPITIVATLLLGNQGTRPQQSELLTTTSGKIVLFDPSRTLPRSGNLPVYHLTAYDATTFAQIWQTCKSTFIAFQGDFPTDGSFDIGNSVIYPGGTASVVGNDIFFNYHGENWHASETGMTYHYNDIGLLQGLFGVLGPQIQGLPGAAAGFGGNSLATHVCQVSGNTYLYFNDENQHAGFHRWKVSNMSSSAVQTVSFTLVANSYVLTPTKTDLLAGVPGGQVSALGSPGWTQNPSSDIINVSHHANGQFYTITGVGNYDSTPSIQLNSTGDPSSRYLKRTLPSISDINYWTISGKLDLTINSFIALEPASLSNPTTQGQIYIEITDGANKAIARIYLYRTRRISFNGVYYGPFMSPAYGVSDFIISRQQSNVYLLINIWGTWISAVQPMYDVTADITNPVSISFNTNNQLPAGHQLGINKLYLS
jgi:hypothetical protein